MCIICEFVCVAYDLVCVSFVRALKLTENPMMQQFPRSQSPSCRDLITAQSGYLSKVMQLIKDRGENPTQAAM